MKTLLRVFILSMFMFLAACSTPQSPSVNDAIEINAPSSDDTPSPVANEPTATPDSTASNDAAVVSDNDQAAPNTQTTPAQTQVIDVVIKGFTFNPVTISARVGDIIHFTNMDSAPHTATAVSGAHTFDSGTLQKGESFDFVVDKKGPTQGRCDIHPSMIFTLNAQ